MSARHYFAVPVWITLIKAIVSLSGGTRGVDQQFQAAALFYVVNELILNEATGQTKVLLYYYYYYYYLLLLLLNFTIRFLCVADMGKLY